MKLFDIKNLINVSSWYNKENKCEGSVLGKMSKLPFLPCTSLSNDCFDKIHCNVWEPALVSSKLLHRFYACLVDNKSKFALFFL